MPDPRQAATVRRSLDRAARPRPTHAQLRRRRVALGAAALVALVIVLVSIRGCSTTSTTMSHAGAAPRTTPTSGAIPAVEAGVLPWSLATPLSREVLLAGGGNTLTVVGGLDGAQASVPTVFTIDTATGNRTVVGALAQGVHDAAGAVIAGQGYLFGGGSPTTVADVERFPMPPAPAAPGATGTTGTSATSVTTATTAAASGHASLPGPPGTVITGVTTTAGAPSPFTATVAGTLPQPRSDPRSVTIGSTTYIVGGYDGTNPDGAVLATTDGRTFSTAATLPVPVRYPAVAALGTDIYVFGGQAVGGPADGQAVDDVQIVDTAAHDATVLAHLPGPLAGASAAVLAGHLYLAGGVAAPAGTTAAPGGAVPGQALGAVWAFDPATKRTLRAGSLPVPTAYAAVAVSGSRAWLVGGENGGAPMTSVQMLEPNAGFGAAGTPGAGSPYAGAKLLVADRGNDRLLVLDDTGQIQWTYPSTYAAAPPGGFYFPDDAFFTNGGTRIISNQEQNETIVVIAFPSGQVLWQYGHPKVTGTQPGFLHEPDDAYLLKNGQITVADAQNCRVLFLSQDKTVVSQIGTNGVCKHAPPQDLGSPNGDTPLADGNVLISEVNGSWVSEYTPQGALVWSVHLPIGYPSDPQQIGPDLYLVSDYSHPGAIVEFTHEGQVLYKLAPQSGLNELNQPSLTELLPSGVFLTNDDYRHRMVAYDPVTGALVWQYGIPDHAGSAPGMLNIPDGFDILLPDGTTPTHLATG